MERLLEYFSEGLPETCWIWKGPVDPEGYGCLKIDGVIYKAHRLVYEYYSGQTPSILCHRCQPKPNKLCVNPSHLHNGSRRDNRRDQVLYGEDARLKIPPTGVAEIRQGWKIRTGTRQEFWTSYAQKYNCSPKTIQNICYGSDRKIDYSK